MVVRRCSALLIFGGTGTGLAAFSSPLSSKVGKEVEELGPLV